MQHATDPTDQASTARAFVSLAETLQKAADAVRHDPATACCCIERAAALLREVQARHAMLDEPPVRAKQSGLARWQFNRIVAHIDSNIDRSLRMRDLAQLIDLSASHFARAFRQRAGTSPRSFVLERRVTRAKMLMRTTDMPLSEIALACGLSDQAHLSRIFRRSTGVTPNAWRRDRRDREKQGTAAAAPGIAGSIESRPDF
ncbi:MAG: helix-turn-helix transcriptional regulator [Rhodopseudomonas palustris]|uniref:Helix-turn-helix transcriptional regulator n=1 Tax=Rhodopseudomonas palustris TaxID=1076 RepID=A0A933RZI1_RHOPL|nr:helix-turn-helix transcriptional regulator [Rhodopseudomonas palustris]